MREMTIVGLHHLQKGRLGDPLACYGFGSSQFEPVSVRNSASQGLVGLSVSSDNKLLFSVNDTTAAVKAGLSQIRLGKLIGDRTDVTEFTIGMRLDAALNPSPTAGYPLICLYNSTPTTGTTQQPISVLLAQLVASVAATSGYYEFTFSLKPVGTAGSKVDVYLDKQFVTSITVVNSLFGQESVKDHFLTFGKMGTVCYNGTAAGLGGIESKLFTIEDIYCVYDNVVADGSTRKGPMRIKPLEVDTNLDTSWVTSDGSARAACLNLPDHHGTVVTPYITSPANLSPMSLRRVLTPIADSDTILAISGATSSSRDAGQAATMSSKWRYNSSVSADVNYVPTAGDYTTQKDVALPTLTVMPDGTPITKAKLANLEMVLTPL